MLNTFVWHFAVPKKTSSPLIKFGNYRPLLLTFSNFSSAILKYLNAYVSIHYRFQVILKKFVQRILLIFGKQRGVLLKFYDTFKAHSKGPVIFNTGYRGGVKQEGGVPKCFTTFSWVMKTFCHVLMGCENIFE